MLQVGEGGAGLLGVAAQQGEFRVHAAEQVDHFGSGGHPLPTVTFPETDLGRHGGWRRRSAATEMSPCSKSDMARPLAGR
ncbi:hypothetical protein KRMM14A1259_17620 [Krasilnikovia sp. MM14-A1259]